MSSQTMLAIASSIQGYGHKRANVPNQDTFAYLVNEKHQVFVAVVSDGAGSATNAKEGSSWCCHHLTSALMDIAVAVLEGRLSKSWYLEKIMLKIGEHINFLSELGDNIKSYHHTMSAVIFSPMGGKIIQIGDSPVVVVTHQETDNGLTDSGLDLSSAIVFDEEKQGEYANVTHFLTNPQWRNHLRIEELPKDAMAVFLMSDGAGTLFTPKKKLHQPAMLELLRRFREDVRPLDAVIDEFLDMEEVNKRTPDDKTLVAYFPKQWVGRASYSDKYQTHNISEQILKDSQEVANRCNISVPAYLPISDSPVAISSEPICLDKESFEKNQIKTDTSTDNTEAVVVIQDNAEILEHKTDGKSLVQTRLNSEID